MPDLKRKKKIGDRTFLRVKGAIINPDHIVSISTLKDEESNITMPVRPEELRRQAEIERQETLKDVDTIISNATEDE